MSLKGDVGVVITLVIVLMVESSLSILLGWHCRLFSSCLVRIGTNSILKMHSEDLQEVTKKL